MHENPIILCGRGPSVYHFDWSRLEGVPIMAVSSGIFGVPEGLIPEHFVTLDEPKYYMEQLVEHEIAWGDDDLARYWPFWTDARIKKHVLATRVRTVRYKHLPVAEIVEAIKEQSGDAERVLPKFYESLGESQHQFGFQPGWGDYQNVQGWEVIGHLPPNFGAEGPLGNGGICNSLFMAIQVAVRLGYGPLLFIGVDLHGEHYAEHRKLLSKWWKLAREDGQSWMSLTVQSALAGIIPVAQEVAAA